MILFIRFWYIFCISYFNYVCELWSPGTVNYCNKHINTFLCTISMISVLFVYCCFLYHPPHSQLYPYRMILSKKVTTKTDVVGCHIGQWQSSTGKNRSPIPVDCCVNAFSPLFMRMRSFNAILVVLRMVWVLSPTYTTIHWACYLN